MFYSPRVTGVNVLKAVTNSLRFIIISLFCLGSLMRVVLFYSTWRKNYEQTFPAGNISKQTKFKLPFVFVLTWGRCSGRGLPGPAGSQRRPPGCRRWGCRWGTGNLHLRSTRQQASPRCLELIKNNNHNKYLII